MTSNLEPRPGIDDVLYRRLEVRFVAGDELKLVNVGGGGDERVHHAYWPSRRLAPRHQLAPTIGDRLVNRKETTLEPKRKLGAQPCIEPSASVTISQPLNAMPLLGERDDA